MLHPAIKTLKWHIFGIFACVFFVSAATTIHAQNIQQETPASITPLGENSENSADKTFRVLDAKTDVADLGNGKSKYRFYLSPRITYETYDGLKVRPPGWNLFHEKNAMRLKDNGGIGYQYEGEFSKGPNVAIRAGSYTKNEDKIISKPAKPKFKQYVEDFATFTEYQDIYPNVTIKFRDASWWRDKEIILGKPPADLDKNDSLIFWEDYDLPLNAEVFVNNKKQTAGTQTVTNATTYIRRPNGERFTITPAIVFDSKDPSDSYKDFYGEAVEQIIRVDYKQSKLSIGLKLPASYLLDKNRVYPVIVDPTYYACAEGYTGSYPLSCSIVDYYIRALNGNADTSAPIGTSGVANNDLFVGLWKKTVNLNYTRHSVMYFDPPATFTNLPGYVVSANLNMYYRNFGNGNAGYADVVVRRISGDYQWWTADYRYLTYSNFRSSLISENPFLRINKTPTNSWFELDVTKSVKAWEGGASNRGLLVEQDPAWPTGSTPPSSWEDLLLKFDSSRNSANTSPFLEVVLEKPDLTSAGSTINKTTFLPGESINLDHIVRNVGAADSRSGLIYYFFEKGSEYFSTPKVKYNSMNPIAVNGSANFNTSYTIPSNTAPGTYYFRYFIDATNTNSESNENNNKFQWTITVAAPDLTSAGSTINKTTFTPGERIDFSHTAKNTGNAGSGNSAYVYYYFDREGTTSCSTFISQNSLPALAANGTADLAMSYTIPGNTSQGNYYFCYFIDATRMISESDENNNAFYYTLTVNVVPELQASESNILDTSRLFSGQQISIRSRLRNTGSANVANAAYQLSLKDSATSLIYPLTNGVLDMPAGFDSYITFYGTIPDNIPLYGTYTAEIKLDPANTVTELDETNNNNVTSNSIPIERYSYVGGGGGGGGSPPPDFDNDGYGDGVEKFGGTNVAGTQTAPLYDPSYEIHAATVPDIQLKVYGADPVNIRTGAFELTEADFSLKGRGIPLELVRTYNSKVTDKNNRFGNGWNSSHNSFYYQDSATKNVQIYHGGALSSIFTTPDNGTSFVPPDGVSDALAHENGYLVYRQLNGTKYLFSKKLTDQIGILEQVTDSNGNTMNFSYADVRGIPLLNAITDASGRRVELTYGTDDKWDKVITLQEFANASTPRIINYIYINGNLTQVTDNRYYNGTTETIERKYEYDAENRMTSYTDPRGTILYNIYDNQGRVTEQHEFNPRIDAVGAKRLVYKLEYLDAPYAPAVGSTHCTTVKSYRDSSTFYQNLTCFNSDELKIYEEDGAGNAAKWEYTPEGLISKYTDPDGFASQFFYDSKRRKTKEILPNTADWYTEVTYIYEDNFNRVTQKTETVTSLADPANQTVKITNYTIDASNGNLLRTEYPLGAAESYTYDNYGNIKTYTNKLGAVTTYQYDPLGNYITEESVTTALTDGTPQNIVRKYEYDVYGNKTKVTSARNNIFIFEYDTQNNLRKETNPFNDSKIYSYDLENHRISETDELGRITTYQFDTDIEASLIKSERTADNETIAARKQYDYVGNLIKEIDPRENEITYVYNASNKISQKIEPYLTTNYVYDGRGSVTRETNNLGQKTEYGYDSRGNLTSVKRYSDADTFIETKNVYDGFSRVIEKTDGKGYKTAFKYDFMDRVTEVKDALGNITTFGYDAAGNKISELLPRAQTDAALRNINGHSATYAYDTLNRLAKATNAGNKETVNFYDADSNLIRTIDRRDLDAQNDTHVARYEYDELNRLKKTIDALSGEKITTYDKVSNVKTKTDEAGRTVTFNYDGFNRLANEIDPLGNTTAYAYDKNGNKTSVTYPDGKQTRYEYDAANRLEKLINVLSATEIYERIYEYDAAGNKTGETDKRGFKTIFAFDKLNRLASETNPKNAVTIYDYDNNGNRILENAAGKIIAYEYDALNRMTKITHPGNKTELFSYDVDSNRITQTNGNNQTINYSFDALSRVKTKTLPEGNIVEYAYDNWGNLLQIKDAANQTDYRYDVLNRPRREEEKFSDFADKTFVIARSYHPDSRLATMTDADSKLTAFEYDERGLLKTVKLGENTLAIYTYTSRAKPRTLLYQNGIQTDYDYDVLNRLAVLNVHKQDGTSLFKHEYFYDAENNRTQLKENGARITAYSYDELEQLKTVDYPELPSQTDLSFVYDANGNRTAYATALGSTNYIYPDNSNELSSYTANGILTVSADYDGQGNLAKESYVRLGKPVRDVLYSWDSQGRLNEIRYQNKERPAVLPALPENSLAFAYDDFGNRIKKSVNGKTVYYINDGLSVLNELNGQGDVEKSIVKGLEQIAEINKNGEINFVHTDALGSTVLITDAAGNAAQTYEYEPFGAIIGETGDLNNKYLFTGQEYDPESELYYYNARYYNPRIGRFLSRDPLLGFDGDILNKNPYIYVKNNPLKYIDPTGNEEEDVVVSSVLVASLMSDMWDATKEAAAWTWDATKTGTLNALDMAPITGDISDAYAMHYGRTLFSGEELSKEDLDLIAAMAPLPLLTGGQVRTGKKVINAADEISQKIGRKIERLLRKSESAKVAGHILEGVPQKAIDRVMDRLKGLRVGDKPVIEKIEAFGSRAGSMARGRGPLPTSDLDMLITIRPDVYYSKNQEWVKKVIDEIGKDFTKAAKFPVNIHHPKNINIFKDDVYHLDPSAKFLNLFSR